MTIPISSRSRRFEERVEVALDGPMTTGDLLMACGWPEGSALKDFHAAMYRLRRDGRIKMMSNVKGVRTWREV